MGLGIAKGISKRLKKSVFVYERFQVSKEREREREKERIDTSLLGFHKTV